MTEYASHSVDYKLASGSATPYSDEGDYVPQVSHNISFFFAHGTQATIQGTQAITSAPTTQESNSTHIIIVSLA